MSATISRQDLSMDLWWLVSDPDNLMPQTVRWFPPAMLGTYQKTKRIIQESAGFDGIPILHSHADSEGRLVICGASVLLSDVRNFCWTRKIENLVDLLDQVKNTLTALRESAVMPEKVPFSWLRLSPDSQIFVVPADHNGDTQDANCEMETWYNENEANSGKSVYLVDIVRSVFAEPYRAWILRSAEDLELRRESWKYNEQLRALQNKLSPRDQLAHWRCMTGTITQMIKENLRGSKQHDIATLIYTSWKQCCDLKYYCISSLSDLLSSLVMLRRVMLQNDLPVLRLKFAESVVYFQLSQATRLRSSSESSAWFLRGLKSFEISYCPDSDDSLTYAPFSISPEIWGTKELVAACVLMVDIVGDIYSMPPDAKLPLPVASIPYGRHLMQILGRLIRGDNSHENDSKQLKELLPLWMSFEHDIVTSSISRTLPIILFALHHINDARSDSRTIWPHATELFEAAEVQTSENVRQFLMMVNQLSMTNHNWSYAGQREEASYIHPPHIQRPDETPSGSEGLRAYSQVSDLREQLLQQHAGENSPDEPSVVTSPSPTFLTSWLNDPVLDLMYKRTDTGDEDRASEAQPPTSLMISDASSLRTNDGALSSGVSPDTSDPGAGDFTFGSAVIPDTSDHQINNDTHLPIVSTSVYDRSTSEVTILLHTNSGDVSDIDIVSNRNGQMQTSIRTENMSDMTPGQSQASWSCIPFADSLKNASSPQLILGDWQTCNFCMAYITPEPHYVRQHLISGHNAHSCGTNSRYEEESVFRAHLRDHHHVGEERILDLIIGSVRCEGDG